MYLCVKRNVIFETCLHECHIVKPEFSINQSISGVLFCHANFLTINDVYQYIDYMVIFKIIEVQIWILTATFLVNSIDMQTSNKYSTWAVINIALYYRVTNSEEKSFILNMN